MTFHDTLRKSALTLIALLAVPTLAAASSITWDFSVAAGDLGSTHTYTVGGVSITATPHGPVGPADDGVPGTNHLYGKTAGGSENGLGLTSDSSEDFEITPTRYIQLDLSNLLAGFTNFQFSMNSSGGDTWRACATATPSTLCAGGITGSNDDGSWNAIGSAPYVDVTATAGNVLLYKFRADDPPPVPEPASLVLLGTGLLGISRRWLKRAN